MECFSKLEYLTTTIANESIQIPRTLTAKHLGRGGMKSVSQSRCQEEAEGEPGNTVLMIYMSETKSFANPFKTIKSGFGAEQRLLHWPSRLELHPG